MPKRKPHKVRYEDFYRYVNETPLAASAWVGEGVSKMLVKRFTVGTSDWYVEFAVTINGVDIMTTQSLHAAIDTYNSINEYTAKLEDYL